VAEGAGTGVSVGTGTAVGGTGDGGVWVGGVKVRDAVATDSGVGVLVALPTAVAGSAVIRTGVGVGDATQTSSETQSTLESSCTITSRKSRALS